MVEKNPEILEFVYKEYWDLTAKDHRECDAFCDFLVYDPGLDACLCSLKVLTFDESVETLSRAMFFDDERFACLVRNNDSRRTMLQAALYFMVVIRKLGFKLQDIVDHIMVQDTSEDNDLTSLSEKLFQGCTEERVASVFCSI